MRAFGTDSGFVPTTVLFLRLPPEWERIDPVRIFVEEMVRARGEMDLADRTAIVVHELLENAVKYGAATRDVELDLRLSRVGREFEVRVSNAVVGSRRGLLTKELARARSMPPTQAYADAMVRSKTRMTGSCGIGLSRVRAEARVELSLVSEQDDWVTVVAASVR